jgi:hypothetical protein
MVSGANAYTIKFADHAVDLPLTHNPFYIVDEEVPFLQMVLHGYIDYAGEAVNDGNQITEDALLKCLETGAGPHFIFSWIDSGDFGFTLGEKFYSTTYSDWIDTAAESYAAYNEIYGDTRTSEIASHEKVAEGVYKTGFANGKAVYVNYNARPYESGGIRIGAKGYLTGWDGDINE